MVKQNRTITSESPSFLSPPHFLFSLHLSFCCFSFFIFSPYNFGCQHHCLTYSLFYYNLLVFFYDGVIYTLLWLVTFKCIHCPFLHAANAGVPGRLPRRPFVILLGLTGPWPDVGYKSNQRLGGEVATMYHANPLHPHQGPSFSALMDIDTDCSLSDGCILS